MKGYDVIAAGLMVMDVITAGIDRGVFDRDTVFPKSITYSTGGDMLNVAVNLNALGARVAASGDLGDDAAGKDILRLLGAYGIDTRHVRVRTDASTATCVVLCEPSGERHFAYSQGANARYDAAVLTDEALCDSRVLFVGSALALPALADETLTDLLRRARALGLRTVMDTATPPDGIWMPRIKEALSYLDVFIPSIHEARALTGEDNPERAAAMFRALGVRVAGVKLGERGVYLLDESGGTYVPALACDEIVDTTGAGDAFMSGFIRGMLMDESPLRCAQIGRCVARRAIATLGAATHRTTMEQVLEILDK